MSHLDLDALASGNVSLGDVLAAAQASAPKAAAPRDQVDTNIPYVINVEEFGRLTNDNKYAYVNRQAQLMIQMAAGILTGQHNELLELEDTPESFTFGHIDQIAEPYVVRKESIRLSEGKAKVVIPKIAEGLDYNTWSWAHGKGYVQLPSVAGPTYIGWLLGEEYWTQSGKDVDHPKNLGKYQIFARA
tara:strand:- start:304 stop:867 length:564 start_codon:yes stop_codon:yes gene_type:complete